MRTYRRLWVRLSKRDRKALRQLLPKGIQPVRTVLRALTLLQLARISHHLTAEARDRPAITSLRLLAVLDVRSSTRL